MMLTLPGDNLSEMSSSGSSSRSESDSSLPEVSSSSSPSLSSSRGLAGLRLAEAEAPSGLDPSGRRSVRSDSENQSYELVYRPGRKIT